MRLTDFNFSIDSPDLDALFVTAAVLDELDKATNRFLPPRTTLIHPIALHPTPIELSAEI